MIDHITVYQHKNIQNCLTILHTLLLTHYFLHFTLTEELYCKYPHKQNIIVYVQYGI